jgi:hypothetical protein
MITKPPLQKILQGILHTENESKQNHERTGEEKIRNQRVILIQLHTIKPISNKNRNDRNHHITININTEC